VSLAKAAISFLRDDRNLSSGVYAPACLEQKFVGLFNSAVFKFEMKVYEEEEAGVVKNEHCGRIICISFLENHGARAPKFS